MRVRYLEPAETDIDEAVEFYEARHAGLGLRLLREVEDAVERVRERPLAWQSLTPDIRHCVLHIFPYSLVYKVDDDEIIVIALAHHKRKPTYWRDRA